MYIIYICAVINQYAEGIDYIYGDQKVKYKVSPKNEGHLLTCLWSELKEFTFSEMSQVFVVKAFMLLLLSMIEIPVYPWLLTFALSILLYEDCLD